MYQYIYSGFSGLNIASSNKTRFDIFNNQTITIAASTTAVAKSVIYAFNLTNSNGNYNYFDVQSSICGTKVCHNVTTDELNLVYYVCISSIVWDSAL